MFSTSVLFNVLVLSTYFVFGVRQMIPDVLYAEDCLKNLNSTIDYDNLIIPTLKVYQDHGRSNLNLSVTIDKPTPKIMFRLVGYRVTDINHRLTERKLDFNIDNIPCSSPIIALILKKTKVKYDKSNCTGYPGHYNQPRFNTVDVNFFYRNAFAGFKWYTVDAELFTSNGVICCISFTLDFSKYSTSLSSSSQK